MPKFKCLIVSTYGGIGHIPSVMSDFGFTYLYAIPRPICDSWEFYGCEIKRLPKDKLPSWARSVGYRHDKLPVGFDDDMFANYKNWISTNFPNKNN